jgi:hypothetical protein
MNMNCHSELDDESQLVDAEGVAHYHMMTGSVNWAIALGRHDIQHAVSCCCSSAPLSHHHHSSYHSSTNSSNGIIIPACTTSINLDATAHGYKPQSCWCGKLVLPGISLPQQCCWRGWKASSKAEGYFVKQVCYACNNAPVLQPAESFGALL